MDDSRFDDIIKGKVSEYEPAGFDPTALADLHQRMAAVSTVPWYVIWRSELLTGSGMVLMTAILLWYQWYWNAGTISELNGKIEQLESGNTQMADLQNQMMDLRNQSSLVDTVRVVEVRYLESPVVASLTKRVDQLESQKLRAVRDDLIFLGAENQIPPNILILLDRADLLYSEDGQAYLRISRLDRFIPPSGKDFPYVSLPNPGLFMPVGDFDEFGQKSENVPIDTKTARALDKHYGKGVGIKAGPEANYLFSDYDLGRAEPDIRFGLLTDLIVSPTLSVETGVRFGQRLIEITDPNQFDQRDFPDQNEFEGDLDRIEIDTKHLEIPVLLKYRKMINPSMDFTFGAGLSGYIIWKEDFEYTYDNVNIGGGVISDVRSDQTQRGLKFYPGNLNAAIGVNRLFNNNKRLEVSFIYQHGVWNVGIEKLSPNFYGLRGVYWFTLR